MSRLDDARNYLDLLECLLVDLGVVDDPQVEPKRNLSTGMGGGLVILGPLEAPDVQFAAENFDRAQQLADDYNYFRKRTHELSDKLEREAEIRLDLAVGEAEVEALRAELERFSADGNPY